MDEILETSDDGRFRVRIVLDDDPPQPEDEMGWPILRYVPNGKVEQVAGIGPDVPNAILVALKQWANESDKFERYLRIYHGTTSVVWMDPHRSSRDWQYVCFDTAAIRLSPDYGLTDEHIAAHPEHFAGRELVQGTADEWLAYCEGECYGYVVEQLVTWKRLDTDEERKEWEEVDSCWGFYGDYVKNEARRAFTNAVETT